MPDISEIVDFLRQSAALDLGGSPWRTYTDDEDLHPFDWDRLIEAPEPPTAISDLDGEFEEVLGRTELGEPEGDSSKRPQDTSAEWDICAWYQPIHFFSSDWGIFILERCVFDIAWQIARRSDRAKVLSDRAKRHFSLAQMFLRASLLSLYYHEHYHHRVECLGLRLHVTLGQPRYVQYSHGIYRTALGTDDLLEEALANANCFGKMAGHPKLPPSIREATRRYLKADFPGNLPGYRMAMNYLTPEKFDAGENLLQGQMKEGVVRPNQPGWHWNAAPHLTRSFFSIKSDIWVVVPRGATPRLPVGALPKTCSPSDLIRLFKAAGYTEDRAGGKGSHVKLNKPGKGSFIVPHQRDLRPGLLNDALKLLGGFKINDLPHLLNGRIRIPS